MKKIATRDSVDYTVYDYYTALLNAVQSSKG